MGWRVIKKNRRSPLSSASEELVEHYEQLRRDAVALPTGRGPALGLTLFLRHGMAGWMRAWSTCLSSNDTTKTSSTMVQDFSLDIRSAMTNILAAMILTQQQETI